jgi:hypothetical protein
MASGRTGISRALGDRDLAREVARQELVAVRSDRLRPPMLEAVRSGLATGLSVVEMQRMSGASRQTIYNAIERLKNDAADQPEDADPTAISLQVLAAVVAGEGTVPVGEVAKRLLRAPYDVLRAAPALASRGLVTLTSAPSSAPDPVAATLLTATEAAEDALRSHLDDLLLTRATGFGVYLALTEEETRCLAPLVGEMLSRNDSTIISADVAPSNMSSAELALVVHAPTSRVAIAIAHDVWDELRDRAGLDPALPRVTAVSEPTGAPCGDSPVLDAFVQAITETAPEVAGEVLRERMRYDGRFDERVIGGRCLTAASRVVLRAFGEDRNPRVITDGDAAWGEFEAINSLFVGDRPSDFVELKALGLEAIDLGVERLGPLPGGRLSTGGIVETFSPSHDDLVAMGRLAGITVGRAAVVSPAVDIAAEVARVGAPT